MFSKRTSSGNSPRPPRDTPHCDWIPQKPSYSKLEVIKPILIIEVGSHLKKDDLEDERQRIMNEYGGDVVMLNGNQKLANNQQNATTGTYNLKV